MNYERLGPGEEPTGIPETWMLTHPEWETTHDDYGLDLDGTPTAERAEQRAMWRKIRRMANGDGPYDEASVREAFGAVLRILRNLTAEVED